VVENKAMSVREFGDDDTGYLEWIATHRDGYVLNILRSHAATAARVHHADCWTINRQAASASAWTDQYVKVCAEHVAELDKWANDMVAESVPRCRICHPDRHVVRPIAAKPANQTAAAPAPDGRSKVQRPTADSPVVQAWADDYIRFEGRPPWQEQLRAEIRALCTQLEPSDEQVLHATFFGAKRPNADIENLVLYNIGSFAIAGRNGIRFEHGDAVPGASGGANYPFCYRHALAPRSGTFDHWQQGRTLASFDWTDLGAFAGDKKLAQVWLALAPGKVEVFEPARAPETPFAVRVQVRPPHGVQPVWGGLVKGIFDGVISAFQAHTDTAILPDVAERLATVLPADRVEIAERLIDQRRAVLGVVPRLVKPYRKGVQWNPADHHCVAGELLAAKAVDSRWAIKGEIVELAR
jgi:hypothetical protein